GRLIADLRKEGRHFFGRLVPGMKGRTNRGARPAGSLPGPGDLIQIFHAVRRSGASERAEAALRAFCPDEFFLACQRGEWYIRSEYKKPYFVKYREGNHGVVGSDVYQKRVGGEGDRPSSPVRQAG